MSNINSANSMLTKAMDAADNGMYERANAYTAIAQAIMAGEQAINLKNISASINRLADVVNGGKSWR